MHRFDDKSKKITFTFGLRSFFLEETKPKPKVCKLKLNFSNDQYCGPKIIALPTKAIVSAPSLHAQILYTLEYNKTVLSTYSTFGAKF